MKIITKIATATALAALASGPAALAATSGPWSGFNAGGQLNVNVTSSDAFRSTTAFGLGVYGGYDMQFSEHFVLGGDIFYNYIQSKTHDFKGVGTGSHDFGTSDYGLDVRAGFPVGDQGAWMPYVKVGYGWLNFHGDGAAGAPSENSVRYGAGVAWMMRRGLSLQLQYMHMDLGSNTGNFQNDTWSLGATWHFTTGD